MNKCLNCGEDIWCKEYEFCQICGEVFKKIKCIDSVCPNQAVNGLQFCKEHEIFLNGNLKYPL